MVTEAPLAVPQRVRAVWMDVIALIAIA